MIVNLEAVLFDFGNTLISIELDWETVLPQNIESLTGYLKTRGIPAEADHFGKKFVENKSAWNQKGREEMHEYKTVDVLAKTLQEWGYPALPPQELEEAVTAYFNPEESLYPVVEGCHEVLQELLNRGLKLGIVSNASSGKLIRDAMLHRGLDKYFQTIIVSADVGYRKPHPAIFRLAMQALGTTAEKSVMVGDVPAYDVEGPQVLGMKSILVSYIDSKEGKRFSSPAVPDGIASHFTEIPSLLEKLTHS